MSTAYEQADMETFLSSLFRRGTLLLPNSSLHVEKRPWTDRLGQWVHAALRFGKRAEKSTHSLTTTAGLIGTSAMNPNPIAVSLVVTSAMQSRPPRHRSRLACWTPEGPHKMSCVVIDMDFTHEPDIS